MKVLFVAHSGELSGGANRTLLTLMAGLREQYGVSPGILIPGENMPLEQRCKALGIPVYTGRYHSCCTVFRREPKDALRFAKLLIAPLLDRREAGRLNKALPEDFDLIYTNERMTCVGAYLAKLRGKPHVWHVRSFSKENRTHFPPCWVRQMNRLSSRVIVISQALYDVFSRHIPPEKMRLVYNGVEPEQYLLHERKPHPGFRLLLAGRVTPAKGQEDALRALEILVRRYGADASLSIAGEAPDYDGPKYLRRLQTLTARLKLNDRVRFLGQVEDLGPVRMETDVELVCSWQEAFGRTTVEAMLAGLPVVGSDAGGTKEIILDGETGLLYPPGDCAALAERLNRLRCQPEEAAQMGRAGKERAMQRFTAKEMVSRVMEVLHEFR